MLKKILAFLLGVMVIFPCIVLAGEIGDRFSVKDWRIDKDGNMTGTNQSLSGDVYFDKMAIHETWIDLAAADSDTIKVINIATSTLIAAPTTWVTADYDAVQVHPRNFTVQIGSDTNGQPYNGAFVGTLLITGVDAKGQAATETINVSTNSTAGVKAFATASSFVLTATQIDDASTTNCRAHIGIGNVIGLSNDISATSSIYKVIATGADEASSAYTANATYDTIDFSDDPDGSSDYEVFYLKK